MEKHMAKPPTNQTETLEHLVARLPKPNRLVSDVPAVEYGRLDFDNGDSILVYIGGINTYGRGVELLFSTQSKLCNGVRFLGSEKTLVLKETRADGFRVRPQKSEIVYDRRRSYRCTYQKLGDVNKVRQK